MTDTRQQFWCNMHDSFLGNVAEENPQLLHDHQQHDLSTSSTSTFLRRLTYVEAARKTAQKLATLDTYAKPFRERFTLTSLVGMFLYLLVGLGYYHGHQRLSVLDSVYFSVTTLITVGCEQHIYDGTEKCTTHHIDFVYFDLFYCVDMEISGQAAPMNAYLLLSMSYSESSFCLLLFLPSQPRYMVNTTLWWNLDCRAWPCACSTRKLDSAQWTPTRL